MRLFRVVYYLAVIVLIVVAGATAWALRYPQIAPITEHASYDAATVAHGAQLAALGDCSACHTSVDGAAYSGGRAVPTPFGTIYSTNITPDPETGIGRWSQVAFRRAMREGIDRQGNHLYPAFPYNHFTKATDSDIEAIYAFLMTLQPVRAEPRANQLAFPLNLRPLVAGWNLLFLNRGAYQPDSAQSNQWNRGAYLAEGLGHCDSCHTPKKALGAEDGGKRFAGDKAENWYAPALNHASPAPAGWTAEMIAEYLGEGHQEFHGKALGPMEEVTGKLAQLPKVDIDALGVYIASFEPAADSAKTKAAVAAADKADFGPVHLASLSANTGANDPGAQIFAGACATCHHSGGGLPAMRPLQLGLSTPVWMEHPANLIQVILHGIAPPTSSPDVSMPPFGDVLTDQQVVDLVTYIRKHFTDKPAWTGIADEVKQVRSQDTGGQRQVASQGQGK